jgi:proline racemase
MATQKYMGAHQLIERLTEQMRTQKSPPADPRAAAIAVLQARGHLKDDGKTFTAAGAKRDAMTAEERALDRAATRTGARPSQFTYNPRTNRAERKR